MGQLAQETREQGETAARNHGFRQDRAEAGGSASKADQAAVESLRVTPEELALAAASLEAKRDAEHRHRETTLPLGDAIDQLGLNMTAEELAPEVEAVRAQRAAKSAAESAARRRYRIRVSAGATMLMGTIVVLGAMLAQSRHTLSLQSSTGAGLPTQKLSSMPDNAPFHIDTATLTNLATLKTTPDQVTVDTRPQGGGNDPRTHRFNNEWTLVKAGSQLYVRGWTSADQALLANNHGSAAVFADHCPWAAPGSEVMVQIPFYEFRDISYFTDIGTKAESYDSTVQAATLTPETEAIKASIAADITGDDQVLHYVQGDNYRYTIDKVDVELDGATVHLTGHIGTEARKQLATQRARKTIAALGVPYTVVNDLAVRDHL